MSRSSTGPVAVWVRGHPVASFILGLAIAGYLALFLTGGQALLEWVAFIPAAAAFRPWTVITYPFFQYGNPLLFLLTLYWAWLVGGELEGALGSARLTALFFGAGTFSAMTILLHGIFWPASAAGLAGLHLPLSGLTIVWCLLNPERVVLFSLLVPVSGRVLAIGTAVLTYLSYGPVRGLFALGGCLFGWLYLQFLGRRSRRSVRRRGDRPRDGLTWLEKAKLRKARRRMKKVWDSDDPDKWVN